LVNLYTNFILIIVQAFGVTPPFLTEQQWESKIYLLRSLHSVPTYKMTAQIIVFSNKTLLKQRKR